MTDRERLIELISQIQYMGGLESRLAEYLLANGVVVLDWSVVTPENRPLITHIAEMPLNDVCELIKAKQEGRVIVPPCKVGQKVYYIFEGEIRELTVISLSYMFSETFKHLNLHTTNHCGAVLSYEIKDIGKTVFLTREEAEEKLKELQK